MMTKLRERTAIVLWLVIIAFVALIVVEWGADFSSTGRGTSGGTNVGVVNGVELSLKAFQNALRNAAQQQGEQQPDRARLVQGVWDAMVRDVLLRQEMEKLGVHVTDAEVVEFTRTQPPPAVRELQAFQTDGAFDPAKYAQFLTDPALIADPRNRAFVMQVESMTREQLLNYKLQRQLMESVHVTPAEVQDFFVASNEKVAVEYLFASAAVVAEDEYEVTDADVQAYYAEHQEEYRHPEQVRLEYVYLPKVATAADSASVGAEIGLLRAELEAGADFAELARSVSEDPGSAENGGDLGTFGRGRMVKPFEDAVFALQPGELSQPVRTRFGWHLIRLEDRVAEGSEEQVHARHILLRFEPSRETEEQLEERIEEFRTRAAAEGFAEAAAAMELEVRDSGFVGPGSMVPGLGTGTAWMVDQLFASEIGTITRVAGNESGFWVARLAEKRPAGIAAVDEVRDRVIMAVTQVKRVEAAAERLVGVREQAVTAGLQDAGEALGLPVRTPEAFARDASIPGIGRAAKFSAAAFALEVGQVSEVVRVTGRGAYLIKVLERVPADLAQLEEQREQLREQLLARKRETVMQNWYAALYDAAEIDDYRHEFGFTY